MKKHLNTRVLPSIPWLLFFFIIYSGWQPATAQVSKLTANGALVEKVAEGFKFTEGPAVDAAGNVFFTDQPNNQILKYSTGGELSVFHSAPGRANGMYFDKDGRLWSCSDENNEIWIFNPDGTYEILISDLNGLKFNGPNDLWIAPDGSVFFTDPLYKRPWWEGKRSPEMQMKGQYVYYLAPGSKQPVEIVNDLTQPNGILGTPDGKILYIADIGAGKTYRYDIGANGTLSNKTLFTEMGSDGMTLDNKGNIYLTGKKGVTVFNKKGEEVGLIAIDANWTANVCFGGADMKTLFVTSMDGLYAIKMKVKGVR